MRDATRLQSSRRMPVLSKIGWDAGMSNFGRSPPSPVSPAEIADSSDGFGPTRPIADFLEPRFFLASFENHDERRMAERSTMPTNKDIRRGGKSCRLI
jgi:hypothetical protein